MIAKEQCDKALERQNLMEQVSHLLVLVVKRVDLPFQTVGRRQWASMV